MLPVRQTRSFLHEDLKFSLSCHRGARQETAFADALCHVDHHALGADSRMRTPNEAMVLLAVWASGAMLSELQLTKQRMTSAVLRPGYSWSSISTSKPAWLPSLGQFGLILGGLRILWSKRALRRTEWQPELPPDLAALLQPLQWLHASAQMPCSADVLLPEFVVCFVSRVSA